MKELIAKELKSYGLLVLYIDLSRSGVLPGNLCVPEARDVPLSKDMSVSKRPRGLPIVFQIHHAANTCASHW